MERKIITEEQKEILISWKEYFEAYMTDKGAFYSYDTPVFVDFCKLVGADCDTLCRLKEVYNGELTYSKEDGRYVTTCLTKRDGCIIESLSAELESEEDFMELYSKETDASPDSFFNDSVENVVRKLKETYPDVVASIEQNVINNIREYDLVDSDKEHFAESYIEDNPVSSVEVAESYLSDDDKKRFIISWVDEL